MAGRCTVAAGATGVASDMVQAREPVTTVRFDTPAGLVTCEVSVNGGRVERVSFDNVGSFLLHRNAALDVEGLGHLTVDIAYGGDFYAFVDADALGLALKPE